MTKQKLQKIMGTSDEQETISVAISENVPVQASERREELIP